MAEEVLVLAVGGVREELSQEEADHSLRTSFFRDDGVQMTSIDALVNNHLREESLAIRDREELLVQSHHLLLVLSTDVAQEYFMVKRVRRGVVVCGHRDEQVSQPSQPAGLLRVGVCQSFTGRNCFCHLGEKLAFSNHHLAQDLEVQSPKMRYLWWPFIVGVIVGE